VPFAKSDGDADIYYEVHGEGPAILFVHGSGGQHAAWWQQVAVLRDRYTVITIDLRGFGNSTSNLDEYNTLEFPADILAVLEASGVEQAVLLGQSIGAAAALKAAIKRPDLVAGVILAHSLGGIDHPELAALVKADRAEAEKLPILDRLMSKSFQESEPAKTFLFRQMGTFNKAKMQDLRNLNVDGPTLGGLKELDVKVMFLAGELDAVLSLSTVKRAHELVEGSVLEIVSNGPHSMYWEVPDLFNAAVERLLEIAYA
jgi:pimeloyl-ACP methyl ester carboxylesterase